MQIVKSCSGRGTRQHTDLWFSSTLTCPRVVDSLSPLPYGHFATSVLLMGPGLLSPLMFYTFFMTLRWQLMVNDLRNRTVSDELLYFNPSSSLVSLYE